MRFYLRIFLSRKEFQLFSPSRFTSPSLLLNFALNDLVLGILSLHRCMGNTVYFDLSLYQDVRVAFIALYIVYTHGRFKCLILLGHLLGVSQNPLMLNPFLLSFI